MFSCCIPFFTLSYRSWSAHLSILFSNTQTNHDYCFPIFLYCHCSLWPYDITQHLLVVIIDTFFQYCIKDPDQLTHNRYHRLHLLQWILLPRPIIVMYFPELFIFSITDIAALYNAYLRRSLPLRLIRLSPLCLSESSATMAYSASFYSCLELSKRRCHPLLQ